MISKNFSIHKKEEVNLDSDLYSDFILGLIQIWHISQSSVILDLASLVPVSTLLLPPPK